MVLGKDFLDVKIVFAKKTPPQSQELDVKTGDVLHNTYRTITRGAKKYIVNQFNQVVSDGFRELTTYTAHTPEGEVKALIGKRGAMTTLLRIPETIDGYFEKSYSFHDIHFDQNTGFFLVETGAMTSILDFETGQKVSKEYHEIFREGNRLYGIIGAYKEKVQIESKYLPTTKKRLPKLIGLLLK